ncbi:MAG: hypothetical protein U0R50_17000 [Gaiellales bacterium]
MSKAKDEKKAKKSKDAGNAGASDRPMVSVATHHRAPDSIARIRSWFAVGAVGLVVLVGWGTGMSGTAVAGRAVLAGLIGYMVGWGVGVGVWREIVKAEVIAAVKRHQEGRR